jgi:hypothetical protein
VVAPFAKEVIEEDYHYPQMLHPTGLKAAASMLRANVEEAWAALTAPAGRRGARGAFSVELAVVVLPDGTAVTHGSLPERRELLQAAARVLTRHVTVDRAMGLARALVDELLRTNTTARAVLAYAYADPECDTCTLRVVIRRLQDIQVGMKDRSVWFRTSHANGFVVDKTTHTVAVLEPSLGSCVPAVVQALVRTAWVHPDYTLISTDAASSAPIVDLSLCTLAAAIQALAVVYNSPGSQTALDAIVDYIHDHQHWLLRLLVRSLLRPRSRTETGTGTEPAMTPPASSSQSSVSVSLSSSDDTDLDPTCSVEGSVAPWSPTWSKYGPHTKMLT